MPEDPSDPSVVRSIAVTVDDVVAAHEANRQRDAGMVLRVTPPYSGRMRARLHRVDAVPAEEFVHVRPADLLADDAPAYPHPDETADALRADPDVEYTRDRHRTRHEAAVETWREAVRDHLVDQVALRTPDGPHLVEVKPLG